jgi:hypothetical protein
MPKLTLPIAALLVLALLQAGTPPTPITDGPEFTPAGLLKKPVHYREWIFLSSGLGMTYGTPAAARQNENPPFDNVFVNRDSYHEFVKSGKWPDQTIFVLEIRASQSKGSINEGGHFQTTPLSMEIHVKDEKRFAGNWAFFEFGDKTDTAAQIPHTASCYSCHEKNGAVDTTFVQFYPTLSKSAPAN